MKKYVKEPGSSKVISAWKKALGIATSAVTYAEILAAFHRKSREERIAPSVMADPVAAFLKDWKSLIIVEVNDKLNELLPPLIERHALRGFDGHPPGLRVDPELSGNGFFFVCLLR